MLSYGCQQETEGNLSVFRPQVTGGGTRPWAACTAGAQMGILPCRRPHYYQGEVMHSILSQADIVH